jgi:hypothetical protein
MDVYPNHTFQPATAVRRGDLAQAVARVLDLVQWPTRPAPEVPDVPAGSLYRAAVGRVVAEGIMDLAPTGQFEPWRFVGGTETVATIDRLNRFIEEASAVRQPVQ